MSDNHTPLDALMLGKIVSGASSPDSRPVSQPQTVRPTPESPPIVLSAPATPEVAAPVEQKKAEVEKPPEEAPETETSSEQTAPVSQFVQEVKEEVEIPPELQKVGLKPVTASSNPAYQNVKLPISDERVLEGLEKPPTSSFRWLAELSRYVLRVAHIQLKKVHGHVIRVFKP